jgi:adenosine deaminase
MEPARLHFMASSRTAPRTLGCVGRVVIALLVTTATACATVRRPVATNTSAERTTAARLEALRGDTAALLQFLRAMPKGADLHSHLSGAVSAESYVRWAAEDGHCILVATQAMVAGPCTDATDRVPATRLLADSVLRNAAIDAWSMRGWRPGATSGHDHFFATFAKVNVGGRGRTAHMLAETITRGASQGVRYMELMMNTDGGSSLLLARRLGYNADFGVMQRRLDSAGLRDSLRNAVRNLDEAEARQRELMGCGTSRADAGCSVVVRYLYQVTRSRSPEEVFAQIRTAFEIVRMEPRIVGFTLVAPEDGPVAMRDFALHMAMIDYLYRQYPETPITLHAGELTRSLVTGEAVASRSHIRQSITLGHARRIGHGVDVLEEDDAAGLLREMAERRVMVEVALSSNALILEVQGEQHPLATYIRSGVPFALVTDDEGVSRSDITHEFMRAVQDQRLDYIALKTAARNSLEHAFVAGKSLWRSGGAFAPVNECAGESGFASASCSAYVRGNPKARLQLELERELAEFESKFQ